MGVESQGGPQGRNFSGPLVYFNITRKPKADLSYQTISL